MTPPALIKKVLQSFRTRKVMTLAQLGLQLHCSPRTVQRRLEQWGALTSYNHNGRYYCLAQVPKFDPLGIWGYQGIGFSRYGNLKATVVGLVNHCPAGLSAHELGQQLGLAPHYFLSHFRDLPELTREKHQGRFVYFSSQSKLFRQQRSGRCNLPAKSTAPSDQEAVKILVQKIKHPDWNSRQIVKRLRKEFPKLTFDRVDHLFALHGLTVKKTPPSN